MPLTPLQVAAINHLVACELSPKGEMPSTAEFAERMGMSARQIERWKGIKWHCPSCGNRNVANQAPPACPKCHKPVIDDGPQDPEFRRILDASVKEARESTDLYALRTRQWALEELSALYKKAKTTPEKRALLKDMMATTEGVTKTVAVTDYGSLPTESLAEIALNRNLTVTGISQVRLAELAKGA